LLQQFMQQSALQAQSPPSAQAQPLASHWQSSQVHAAPQHAHEEAADVVVKADVA
jgi:hypothetical protein